MFTAFHQPSTACTSRNYFKQISGWSRKMEETAADTPSKNSGRPRVDLEPYKAEIVGLHEKKMKSDDICKHLKRQHDIQISSRTLTKRLQHWGVKKKMENNTSNQALHARIKNLFFEVGLSDQEIVTVLHDEGYDVSNRTLRRLRHQLGIRLRLDSPAQQEAQVQEILNALTEEMDKGTIEGYGKELLHNHFRSKGYVFARDRLYNVYRMMRPDTVERRTSEFQRRPPPPKILAGPNLTWHVNGYSKLANFGIRIHAEIDSYSRYVLWIHVGVDAHTAMGVLKHHLESVSAKNRQPRTLRSDLESEVPLLADAHFALRRAAEPDVQREQCCAPGRANDTHRVESWWAQLAKSVVTLYHVSLPTGMTRAANN
jgi:transposase